MSGYLITGCTGLLGSNLCHLLKNDHRVSGLSRGSFGMEGVRFCEGSFCDEVKVRSAIEEAEPETIIHCAAMTNVDECERRPDEAMRINSEGSVALCRIAGLYGVRMVLVSTDAVFSGDKDGLYREEDEPSPLNVYGKSKVSAERGILELDSKALVVRTNLYGFNWRGKQSLSEWVVDSLSKDEVIDMFPDVVFTPLLANSLARAIDRAIGMGVYGVLHLSCTQALSKYDFGSVVKERMSLGGSVRPRSVATFPFDAPRSRNMALDCGKAIGLGIDLPSPWEDIEALAYLYECGYQSKLRGRS